MRSSCCGAAIAVEGRSKGINWLVIFICAKCGKECEAVYPKKPMPGTVKATVKESLTVARELSREKVKKVISSHICKHCPDNSNCEAAANIRDNVPMTCISLYDAVKGILKAYEKGELFE